MKIKSMLAVIALSTLALNASAKEWNCSTEAGGMIKLTHMADSPAFLLYTNPTLDQPVMLTLSEPGDETTVYVNYGELLHRDIATRYYRFGFVGEMDKYFNWTVMDSQVGFDTYQGLKVFMNEDLIFTDRCVGNTLDILDNPYQHEQDMEEDIEFFSEMQ